MKIGLPPIQNVLQAILFLSIFALGALLFLFKTGYVLPPYGEGRLVPIEQINPDYAKISQEVASLLPNPSSISNVALKDTILAKTKILEGIASQEHLKFWTRLTLFFFAAFAALAFLAVAAYANRRYKDNNPDNSENEVKRTTAAYRWFAGAMFLWVASNGFNIYKTYFPLDYDFAQNYLSRGVISIFSSINSMCIMLALTYLGININENTNNPIEKAWNHIKLNAALWRRGCYIITVVVIIFDLCAMIICGNSKKPEFFFDALVLSPLTSILLGSGLFLVFKHRDIIELSRLAIFTMTVTLFSQILNILGTPDSLIFFIIKALFSFLYTSFLVILLFSLVLSWLGWQKNELLEIKNKALKSEKAKSAEKEAALETAIAELRTRENELQNQNELNHAFISIVSDAMSQAYMERLFEVAAERLRADNVFDYFFGLAIQKTNSDMIYFPYYKYDTDSPKRNYATLPEGTYVGLCLQKNKEIFEPDLNQPSLLSKIKSGRRSREIAPKSRSLIYLPLVRPGNSKPFGAITIQWRKPNRSCTENQLTALRNIASLFAKVIDPEKILLRPEIAFIRNAAEGRDAQYHFDPEKNKTQVVRPNGYELLDDLMKWSKENTDSFLSFKVNNLYDESSFINRLMKGISTGICSCGAVLLALTSAAERMRGDHGEAGNPVVMEILQNLFQECNTASDTQLNFFFKGREEQKGNLEERFGTLFSLFQVLFFVEGQEEQRTPNLINADFDLKRCDISFEFGINNVAGLKQKIEENWHLFRADGEKALQHSLSSKIVLLMVHFSGGSFKCEPLSNSIKLTFAL